MNAILKKTLKKTFVYDIVRSLRQARSEKLEDERKRQEIALWESSGRPIPAPHAFKEKVVREYGAKFAIRVLVETGTYLGEMIEASRKHFKKIYSIELSDSLFERAKKKFEKQHNIFLYKGDSSDVLPEILTRIDKPALFWLDAHYSEGITTKGRLETPILQELVYIFSHTISNHVILVDDARCFTGERDYPTLFHLKQFVNEYRPDLICEVKDDIIRIH